MEASRPIRLDSDILVVRPFLALRRADLRAYLEHRGLPFRHDATNEDPTAAARNLIRHEVLPLLEKRLNPEAASALVRLADRAREAGEALELLAERALNDIRIGHARRAVTLSIVGMAALPTALQKEVLLLVLKKLGAPLKGVDSERLEAAVSAAAADRPHRRRIELPGGVVVERDNRQLSVRRAGG
jgi:tRNA(Ile)-lysidine synthase